MQQPVVLIVRDGAESIVYVRAGSEGALLRSTGPTGQPIVFQLAANVELWLCSIGSERLYGLLIAASIAADVQPNTHPVFYIV